VFSKLFQISPFDSKQLHLDYRVVCIASCLLSIWLITIEPVINRDAIIYLRTAEAYLQDGLLASQLLFDRPLLPIIIALIHKATGIPLVNAGHLVITFFYALLAIGFVSTIRVLGGDRRVQIFAAIIIISHPMLNSSRASIMRDPAYWALSILAFRQLLLFARCPNRRNQLYWFAFTALASLFRFEGLFFILLSPLALLFVGEAQNRKRNCLQLMILPLIAIAALASFILVYQLVLFPGEQLFRGIGAYVSNFLSIADQFASIADNSADSWLEFTSRDDSIVALLGGLAAILAINIIRAITWPYFALLLWGHAKQLFDRISTSDRILINSQLVICLLYLVLFLLTKRFMLERYCEIFTLFALLYLPFIINSLWRNGRKFGGKILVALLLLAMSMDAAHNSDYKKAFIADATNWLIANTPEQSTVMTNSTYIAYFGRPQAEWEKRGYLFKVEDLSQQTGRWAHTDYLVILMKTKEIAQWEKFLDENELEEIQSFSNASRGKVGIVKIPELRRTKPAR
jgi:hypothetical protein